VAAAVVDSARREALREVRAVAVGSALHEAAEEVERRAASAEVVALHVAAAEAVVVRQAEAGAAVEAAVDKVLPIGPVSFSEGPGRFFGPILKLT
jgi:hypothetical protein